MSWLNYHHLLYFWTVAREGSIARACMCLHLTQPTISGQLRSLERALGAKLFDRVGRNLVLTPTGRMVYRYADDIFRLGRELQDTVKGRPAGQPLRLVIGVVDTLPKMLVYRLIEPALRLPEQLQVVCHEGTLEELLAQLAVNALDMVLADAPCSPFIKIRAFNHLLGECSVSFLGTSQLVAAHRHGFPRSLDGAPVLLPTENSALRRSLEQWFDAEGIRPLVRGEFADSGVLKVFGRTGLGLFAIPTAVEKEVKRQYGVRLLGRVASIREQFYAISVERRLKHPAVAAITDAARKKLFARGGE
ncbi:MAG: transcriptional activator NhaR [Planctomycetia bacterium]|nr:transcriptional activator NhaR [Planctomycetia bacterium]